MNKDDVINRLVELKENSISYNANINNVESIIDNIKLTINQLILKRDSVEKQINSNKQELGDYLNTLNNLHNKYDETVKEMLLIKNSINIDGETDE